MHSRLRMVLGLGEGGRKTAKTPHTMPSTKASCTWGKVMLKMMVKCSPIATTNPFSC